LIRASALALALVVALPPVGASAHAERPTVFPDPFTGKVPRYRTSGPLLVVCKPSSASVISHYSGALKARNQALLARCTFHDIQAAVNHVKHRNSRIAVLPGTYLEKPSLANQPDACLDIRKNALDRDTSNDMLTYQQQVQCANSQNLIAWFGDSKPDDSSIACNNKWCGLQLEGTGAKPEDVVIDGRFQELNVIRADRADGAYFRNFTVQGSHFNGLYVIETNGYAMDRIVFRNNDEYGVLTFSVDHGLIENCEAYGNGDSGVYPGGQAELHGARPSTEVRGCFSHHNELGYSGTAGNSTYVHDNTFAYNAVGLVTDSFYGGHPGLPQDGSRFVHNRFFSNNQDFNKNWANGLCDKPATQWGYYRWHGERIRNVCPTVPGPIGVGLLIAGGNQNTIGDNWIYDNWRYGTYLFWVPATFRDDNDPDKQHDTSHGNEYVLNRMGVSPSGQSLPNGLDFWWDQEGAGNCWESNYDPNGITSEPDPSVLPDCSATPVMYPGPTIAEIATCATWSQQDPYPPGCNWFEVPPKPSRAASGASGSGVPDQVGAVATGLGQRGLAPPSFDGGMVAGQQDLGYRQTLELAGARVMGMVEQTVLEALYLQGSLRAHNTRYQTGDHFK
jgi:hypothetical protein